MRMCFTKMQGCGNDYIYFNCLKKEILHPNELSKKLSDRRFSIGGDGIVLICHSDVADAKMRIFNSDGSEAKMCGNGIRCVGKYLFDNNIVKNKYIKVETLSGVKHLEIKMDNIGRTLVTVDMGLPSFKAKDIPVKIMEEYAYNYPISFDEKAYKAICLSMGNPHCVIFCENPNMLDILEIAGKIEKMGDFSEGVNIEFVKIINEKNILMRVHERGSGETLACGTGACAAVCAAIQRGYCKKNSEITAALKGGILKIKYTGEAVFMTGTAEKSFEGVVEI